MKPGKSCPFFSILIPTYNRGNMIAAAVNSVLNQSFTDWELIIIDDGSTDNTSAIIQPFLADDRIQYHYQENQERSAARNKGISLSNGRFICFLDSDDYYLPLHLQILYDTIIFHNEKKAVYYTGCQYERNGKRTNPKPLGPINGNGIYNILFNSLLLTNSICVSAPLLEEDRFPVHLSIFEDNHLWIRLVCRSELIAVQTITNIVVEHGSRSLNYSASELDKKTKKYIHAVNDLFYSNEYPCIKHCISEEYKKEFIASKYIVMAFEAMHLKSTSLVYKYLYLSVKEKPALRNLPAALKLFFFSWIHIAIKSTVK